MKYSFYDCKISILFFIIFLSFFAFISDVNITVYICNVEKEEIESVHQIRTTPCQNIPELKKLLQNYIPLKSAEMHLVLIKPTSLEYMSDSNDLPLNKLGFSVYNRASISFKLFLF